MYTNIECLITKSCVRIILLNFVSLAQLVEIFHFLYWSLNFEYSIYSLLRMKFKPLNYLEKKKTLVKKKQSVALYNLGGLQYKYNQ
jgi:hypothetical protein